MLHSLFRFQSLLVLIFDLYSLLIDFIMFSKKKKKPQISRPINFEHRVHTGFDQQEGKYVV